MRITPDTELCERRASINETATLSRCYPDEYSGFLLTLSILIVNPIWVEMA